MKLDHFLTLYTKTHSKWMKDLNVRQEIIQILEEKTGSNLFDLTHSNFLLDKLLETRGEKSKNELLGFIKIESFCTAKETINKTKRQQTE